LITDPWQKQFFWKVWQYYINYNHSVLMNAIIVKTFKKAVLIELLVSSEKIFLKGDNEVFVQSKVSFCMTFKWCVCLLQHF